MPVRWATKNGNWSDLTVWNDSGSLGFPTASDDIFTNTFTVNVDQSFEALTLNNSARARTIVTPVMTSNTTPSPVAIAANNEGNGAAWTAFNRVTNVNGWYTNGYAGSAFISVDFGSPTIIDAYIIYGLSSQALNPQVWTFDGSNNNSTWTPVHSASLASAIGSFAAYSSGQIGNTTSYRYYRINITANGGSGIGTGMAELELYQPGTAALAAGGSFNFNSGSISGSVTSTSPLSAGATNLITVTATTGSVGLTLGGAVTGLSTSTTQVINHTGNCDFRLSGTTFTGGSTSINTARCIVKSSLGTIIITGSLNGGLVGNGFNNNDCLVSTAGNTIVLGNVNGGIGSVPGGGVCRGINQSAGNLTVIGNVTSISPTATQQQAIFFTGTSLTVNGNVIGGAVSEAINTTAPTTVIGNVSGSATNGITTTAPVIVSGSVIATGAAAAISAGANVVFINVSGSVIASATSNAITATAASSVVNLAGNIVNVNGKQAIYCQNLFLSNTQTTQARFFTFGGSDRTLYSSDTFPNLPSASNVRFGTTYGPGSGNTGTLRMASPQDVRSGVLTDNTTGSAILSMESLSNEIQTSSDPFAQRLRNISTVDVIGNLLTAFKK